MGALGGPERRTEIVALSSGFEERNSPWAQSRRRFEVGHALSTLDDISELTAFFEARHGRLYGFRYKDPIDHKSCLPTGAPLATDQALGTGDGTTTLFPLTKTYSSGPTSYVRLINKPVTGSVLVAVDGVVQSEGVDFLLDASLGTVTFQPGAVPASGHVVTAGFEFDVPVRFDQDRLVISLEAFAAGEAPDISLVELRL